MFYGYESGGTFSNFSIGYNQSLAVDTISRWKETYTSRFGFSSSNTAKVERSYMYGKRSPDSKTISWYSTMSATDQMNTSSQTFYYLALG